MEKQRSDLKILFRDGARPTGNDFSDLFDSFIHRTDDGFTFNTNGAQINNFTLGNFSVTPVAGSMRFLAGEVQFFDGTAWKNVSSNDLGFRRLNQQPSSALPDAAYFGKIGINVGTNPGANLTDDLEVGIPNSAGKTRAGTAVVGGHGPGGARAMLFHSNVRTLAVNGGNPEQNYGFAQNQNGGVFINTVTNQRVTFSTNDTPEAVLTNGRFVIGGTSALTPGTPPPPNEIVRLHVHGHAIKANGGGSWLNPSDIRTKKDIRDFTDGLEKLKALNPIVFRYNGMGGTPVDEDQIGLSGQEVEKICPYMVKRLGNEALDEDGVQYPEDMILLDSSPLIFLMMNAIRELDDKIRLLENTNTRSYV